MGINIQPALNILPFRSPTSVNTRPSIHCPDYFRVCKPRYLCGNHLIHAIIPDNIEDSRQKIWEGTKARLDDVRDALVSQTHSTMHDLQERMQKDYNTTKDLQRPLDDELLELTRKDGTVITMTLGKRIDAYRKLVNREKQNLNHLFEQWQEVSREINTITTELLGSEGAEDILKGTDVEVLEFDSAEQRALMAELEAEMERARTAAAAIGAKAVKLMQTGEKASPVGNIVGFYDLE
ncbi:MAG: hypothetical protein Q9226_000123 [Calogaya cf. arnoldii]